MHKHLQFLGFLVLLSPFSFAQQGCMDPVASNYDASALVENYSCQYSMETLTFDSLRTQLLPHYLRETSGLTVYNGLHWTHNDDGSSIIYGYNPTTAQVEDSLDLGINVYDWEELHYHNGKFYLGDFGNNGNGARTNLRIFRYDLATNTVDTIRFNYFNQTTLTPVAANSTLFDCEAFLVNDEKIYLFTKQWGANQTELHVLQNIPGAQTSEIKGTYNCQGMITGATYIPNGILLVGYTQLLAPFMIHLKDFEADNYFISNKRRFQLDLGLHQVEAISFDADRQIIGFTNETFSVMGQTIPAKFVSYDWNIFVAFGEPTEGLNNQLLEEWKDFPIYQLGKYIYSKEELGNVLILDTSGKEIYSGAITSDGLNTENWSRGSYFVQTRQNAGVYRLQLGE